MPPPERGRAIREALGRMSGPASIAAIPSGWPELDWVLGGGGYPRGRIVEVFGPESCGKTTIALRAAAETQKAGGSAAYIDAEFALDAARARSLGVDMERLVLIQPRSGEEALDIARTLASSRAIDLVVVDSVAALAPRMELEQNLETPLGALQSRLLTVALRKLSWAALRTGTCLLFLNQIRSSGHRETTAGGNAVRLHAAVRVELGAAGARIEARTLKNKLAPPFRSAQFEL